METTKAVLNQKVFVQLSAVLDLQKRYLDTVAEYKKLKEQGGTMQSAYYERKRTMEQMIDLLGLPIQKV